MRISFPLLIAILLLSSLQSEAEKHERDFGFQPLEIYTFKRGTSRLTVADLNRDGLDDILFANNLVSRMEILIRKPEEKELQYLPPLKDRFEDRGIIVDQSLKAIRVADLNNDQRPDLISFGSTLGLQIRYQQKDGSFSDPERIFIKDPSTVTTFQIGDLDLDARPDILICRRSKAELYWNRPERPFQQTKTISFSTDKSYYGDIADLNHDDHPDLIFYFTSAETPLRVRLGKGNGQFALEQPVAMPPRQYMDILQTPNTPPHMGMVLKNRLAFRLYDFMEEAQPPLTSIQEISPARIGLEGTAKKHPPAWAATDFNQDGYEDLLVSAPELSRLHLYTGSKEGLNPEPVRIDTLTEVDQLSVLANGDLLVVSKKEKIAAIHQAGNMANFPRMLNLPEEVLTGCALQSGNECWFICRQKDGEPILVRQNQKNGKLTTFLLDLENDPEDLLAFSLPGKKIGIILFMPYDTPEMRIFDGKKLMTLTSKSFRALTQSLTRSNILMENPGKGDALIISQGAIARRFVWTGEGYEVTRQFNPENPRGELIAASPLRLLDGTTGTWLYDRDSTDLIRFTEQGPEWNAIHIPDADPSIFNLVQLSNPDRDTLVLMDQSGLNVILGNGNRLTTTSIAEYVSPTETPKLAYAKQVKLGTPPRPMVALVDQANRAIELVSHKDNTLVKELAFEVFLASGFADPRMNRGTEPHDLESGDFNGDGTGDLIALSQDKLLIYLGE